MTIASLILQVLIAPEGADLPVAPSVTLDLSRVADFLSCRRADAEIVVCARRPFAEPYRIPPELREEPLAPQSYSWTARARDERVRAGYDQQIVGPAGALNYSRQVDCNWRAERQEMTGQVVDCTLNVVPLPGQ
jgi:hypothetical protein